ncbi:high-potential iron-sulfur protein [Niabella soli]|uniref:High-potential iron-sulfur protein n=1 Tax=Niabella soli DSM 19437 TaxID=929713 RepID=W0EZF9_9BACT|nr:high-potential iron-sulfur protein [Niabella soli]AHF14486.1 iron permease [Niabella soli DSM 19437]
MQDRRKFLRQVFFSAGTAIAGAALLQACGNDSHTTDKPADTTASGKPAAVPEAPANAIIDSAQMTQEDFDKRKNLGYVEKTPMEDKHCENCALYLRPEGDKKYGGCQLLRGPIAPGGYCTYWAEKQG